MVKYFLLLLTIGLTQCEAQSQNNDGYKFSEKQHDYWYSGKAEITSFDLQQVRYGEVREGKAVLVFVTEPFSKQKLVKADYPKNEDPSVLKLNFTKKFNTGIYPYSMMTSSFFPIGEDPHSLKITSSSQEWCGHTFMEMKNGDSFEFNINSYFENESIENLKISKSIMEDDVWSMIRINPTHLPIGNIELIPSFFFLRLNHIQTKAYDAIASITEKNNLKTYTIKYTSIPRELSIHFTADFPYTIERWEEKTQGDYPADKQLITTGKRSKTLRTDYWNKNSNKDIPLRDQLNLDSNY